MQTPEASQGTPYPSGTRVRLLVATGGSKEVDAQRVSHQLPAGAIVSITEHKPFNRRTSTNTLAPSANDFIYKLSGVVKDNVIQKHLDGPYVGTRDDNKIPHTELNVNVCPPEAENGMYKPGDTARILPGHTYVYPRKDSKVTLGPDDILQIDCYPTSKSGGKTMPSPQKAYYLRVYKVAGTSVVAEDRTWRSDYAVSTDTFEVVA